MAVASTKIFTAEVTVLYLLMILLARQRGMCRGGKADRWYRELEKIPTKIEHILEDHRAIQSVAIKYAGTHWHVSFG